MVNRNHRQGLAAALRVPDETPPLRSLGDSLHHLLHGSGLVLAENLLRQFIVLRHEQHIIPHEPEKPRTVEERLDLGLVVTRLLITPVEEVLPAGAPRHAVEKVQQLGDLEYLRGDEHLRCFPVITANLVNSESDTILFRRILQFRNRDRDAVDQEDDIGAVAKDDPLLPPLVGDLELVVFGMLEVYDLDVAFPVLLWNKDRLYSPRSQEWASRFPSILGWSRLSRRRMSGVRLRSTTPGVKTNKLSF